MNSQTTPDYWKLYRRLPKTARREARKAYKLFATDPTHPSLQFHRLHYDPSYWSARVTKTHRAVGVVEGDTITWVWIGSHANFDRDFPD